MKKCAHCKETKESSEFGKHKQTRDGLKHACKVCVAAAARTPQARKRRRIYEAGLRKRQGHREWKDARAAAYSASPHGRAVRLLSVARQNAASRGVKFDIRVEWLEAKLVAGICELTGLKLSLGPAEKDNRRHPRGPSLDRIDHKGGYTEDNVRVVCWQANVARNEWDDTTLLELAEAFVRTISSRASKEEGSTTMPLGSTPKRAEAPGTLIH